MKTRKFLSSFLLSTMSLAASSAFADAPGYDYGGGTGPTGAQGSFLSAFDDFSFLGRDQVQVNDGSYYRSHTVCLERGRTYSVWLGSFDFNVYPYLLPYGAPADGRLAIVHAEGGSTARFFYTVPQFGGPSCNATYANYGGGTGVSYAGALYQLMVNSKFTGETGHYHLVVEKY